MTVYRFPDPRDTPPNRPVAIGGNLSADMLLSAYAQGLFPWSVRPVTWWCPDPRGVLPLAGFKTPRSLRQTLKKTPFTLTFNQAFTQVMTHCARPAPGRETTWIAPQMIDAYTRLHQLGHAHSVECWLGSELAGGLYGVSVGGLFSGESMFHVVPDASKAALAALVGRLKEKGFVLLDTQMVTPVLSQMGAIEIPRAEYLEQLQRALQVQAVF